MFDDWPKKKKKKNFLNLFFMYYNSQWVKNTSLVETILAKLRFTDKVTGQNYRNLCFPAEIVTIISVEQFDIALLNRKPSILFPPFMCHCGYFKPLWEVNGYRIEIIWILGMYMYQLNMQISTYTQTDDKLSLLTALLSYHCGYYRAFVEVNAIASLVHFLMPLPVVWLAYMTLDGLAFRALSNVLYNF